MVSIPAAVFVDEGRFWASSLVVTHQQKGELYTLDCGDDKSTKTSVKITVKFIQRYNNTFATYHALINLKGGLIQTPPKSQFMQSTHKMYILASMYSYVLINVVY